MTKPKLQKTGVEEVRTAVRAPAMVPETIETKKPKSMGRPKKKPESRQTSYHLPVTLIDRIEQAAAKYTAGNKSFLAERALDEYLIKLGE